MHNIKIVASTRHGKAVSGRKKTSTIQVRDYCIKGGYLLLAQFRFVVGDAASAENANAQAEAYAEKVDPKWASTEGSPQVIPDSAMFSEPKEAA